MDIIPTEKIDACEQVTAMNSIMSDEFQRFETFKKWPKSHIISPSSLAQAGLYYLNRDDYVQCAFCLVTMNNWVIGDNAIEEHHRHSQNCSFIMQLSNRYKCIKCIHADVQVVFFPCLHIISCEKCASKTTHCTICGESIKSHLRVRFQRGNVRSFEQCG